MKWLCCMMVMITALRVQSSPDPGMEPPCLEPVNLRVTLVDGSVLAKARPVDSILRVGAKAGGGLVIDWRRVNMLSFGSGEGFGKLELANGDRLTVRWIKPLLEVDHLLGRVGICVREIREVMVLNGKLTNVALGKPVHGADGASHGKGVAKHVTDGDPATHAKPPASNFEYRIDLQAGTNATYAIDEIVINWGKFGDRFLGVRKQGAEEWASAAWPGEYVTSYTVEMRQSGEANWVKVHDFKGRPADEQGPNLVVQKRASKEAGCSTDSMTCLRGLKLKGVAELRVRASGSHWIGLYELEAFGAPEAR